jgi:hypothetical protein
MERKWPIAVRNAQIAFAGLPKGSPDSLRAQDIELSARAELEKKKKKGR